MNIFVWLRPMPNGMHEATIHYQDGKQAVYNINQSVAEQIGAVIEGRGLIIVSEYKLQHPPVEDNG